MYNLLIERVSFEVTLALRRMIEAGQLRCYQFTVDYHGYPSAEITTDSIEALRSIVAIIDEEHFTHDDS